MVQTNPPTFTVPQNIKIFHITHVNNLAQICAQGGLYSDAQMQHRQVATPIGMQIIKQRRLTKCRVSCHANTFVGEYVPFNFCPRSVMLYILHRGNHPDITYTEGQRPLVHLMADLNSVVQRANQQNIRWAFTDRNAGTLYTTFYNSLTDLNHVNWPAMQARDFRDTFTKEGKQAEFLHHDFFPWDLVEEIGVHNAIVERQIQQILNQAQHKPVVNVKRDWYF